MMDRRRRFSAFVASDADPRSTIVEAVEVAREFLAQSSLDERARIRGAIVVEEIVANTLRHGGEDKDVNLWLSLSEETDGILLELEDDGAEFDPTRAAPFKGRDPQTGGGIGLAIVRAWGEDLSYRRTADRNVLQLTIR